MTDYTDSLFDEMCRRAISRCQICKYAGRCRIAHTHFAALCDDFAAREADER